MKEPDAPPRTGNADFLSGGGEMAALIRATDWSKTSLGAIDAWPQSLRTTVSLCLASNFPINIIWGPEHNQIYNDGYRIVCGDVHPQALGEAYTKTWASAWPAIGEPFARALTGATSYLENQRMFLFRNGYLEETFFTFSLSPIRDETGGIGGLFHPVTETTASMLSGRRTRLLRDLNARLGEARTTRAAYDSAVSIIADHPFDVPFALLYDFSAEADAYHRVGQCGLEAETAVAPTMLSLDATSPWPVASLLDAHEPILLDLSDGPLNAARAGPYDEPPKQAFAFPILVPGSPLPIALLFAGVSPRLPLDEPYRGFFSLLAAALSAGLVNARTYEEERKRAEMLAALDRAKTTFFSNVSHEFRTPLTLMLGPIEDALADAGGLAPVQKDRLDIAHRNALRLLKLVNSLLDFSRIEAGRMQASFEPTDLAALTAGLASSFDSACARAGLALVIDCPTLAEPVYVDRDLWEKVVLNLISNAFKFTLEGTITVTLCVIGRQVELVVSDTGVGIAEAELPRVFERFHRIEGQKGRTFEGTGIGLALVDELVKLHGGAIRAESRLGQGSQFRVTIPLGSAHLPPDQLSAGRSLSSTAISASAFVAEAQRWLPETLQVDRVADDALAQVAGRPRVVLADDNADMRGYVKKLLEEGGYEVAGAENGRAALEIVKRGPTPDLVLTDVMMPELDGFGLLAALRADPSLEGLLVILLSARAGEEARVEGLAAGADDYLVKPFSARELRARVDGAVKLARQRSEASLREQNLRAEVAVERGKAELRQSEQRLAYALEAGRMGSWELDLRTGQSTTSDFCRALYGLSPNNGAVVHFEDVTGMVHPEDRERRRRAVERAIADKTDIEMEYRVVRPDGRVGWLLSQGQVAYEDDQPVRIAGVVLDITARKIAEERQRLMIDELNHRVKNTLATVQSIALQTRRAKPSSKDEDAFLARIQALARAHDLLTQAAWESASLADVIDRTLTPHVGDAAGRMRVSGPAILLGPNAAVTLNMAFHELATNAFKYGALSNATGRVDVEWRLNEAASPGAVEIEWRESGGPVVVPPKRRGFGSRLIERGLAHELDGDCYLMFQPEGLRCRIHLPISAKLRPAP